MQNIQPVYRQVTGQTLDGGYTAHLDPIYVFKGKLRAAATRAKFHDSAGLRWLEQYCNAQLRQSRNEFSLDVNSLPPPQRGDVQKGLIARG